MRCAAVLFAAVLALAATAADAAPGASPMAPGEATYALTADAASDSLLARVAGDPPWRARRFTRPELANLCERLAAARATLGDPSGSFRLTLVAGEGADGKGRARIELVGVGARRPSHLGVVVQGASWNAAQTGAVVERAARGGTTPEALRAGVEALREEALRRGHANAEATLDSLVVRGDSAIAFVGLRPGPVVRVDSLTLDGASGMRPAAAQSIAGLRRGTTVTPSTLAAARERLEASGLFVSVGTPVVAAGATPAAARIVVPVEERRVSRFEGAVGMQQGTGATGMLDLALGNIAGSGRGVGLRWHGFGAGRSEYAAHYREPALLGRPVDGAIALEGSLAESLYTQTRWELRLGAVLGARARTSLGVEHSGTDYTGTGSGTSGTWAATAGYERDGLEPRVNPRHGAAVRLALSGGRRTDRVPGIAGETRGLARVSASAAGAVPLGRARTLHASVRAERTALQGDGGFPAEELLYLGGSEGLRGHADRAYGGDRILAGSLEHRWLGSGESRAYVFLDAGYHGLGAPLATGSVLLPDTGSGGGSPALPSSLARTQLSDGWEFGYGAGLVTRMAAGSVGIELGFAPGASVREGKLHLRYASQW